MEENVKKSVFKYEKVLNYIQDLVTLHKGELNYKLPSETNIMKTLNVSRITAISGLSEAENMGLIERIKGKGSFIKNYSFINSELPPRDNLIGVLVPDLKSKFMTSIVNSIESVMKEKNFSILLSITEYTQSIEEKLINSLISSGVKGLIIYPSDNQTYNKTILKLSLEKFPIVLIDREFPGISINCVSSSHTTDCYKAVNYLISLGHKNIGYISTRIKSSTTTTRRYNGYQKALFENDIPINHKYICESLDNYDEDWDAILTSYVKRNREITAYVASCSDIGYKFMKVLAALNKKIPDDVSLLLYDEEYTDIFEFMSINPTRIEQKTAEIGAQAAKLLLDTIDNPNNPIKSIKVSSNIIIGLSTAPIQK